MIRSRIICIALSSLIAPPCLLAQSTPKERKITHREQSLKSYNPFTADEMWKHIKIPPAPPLSVEKALASFKTAPGFKVECVASEPLVVDPVTFEFDPDGRIWAVEMRGWMRDLNGTGEADPIGKIVVLEDTNGDSVMDKSTVFLDGLVMPRTLAFVEGGVLVAEPPNLWFCEDTDGDLKCDRKTKVADWGQAGNPEHTENGLMHAIDNWMYNAKSTERHKFVDGKLIAEKTIFRGQWGMAMDDYGRLFYNYENSSLHADLFPAEYVMRNKHIGGRSSYGLNTKVASKSQEVFPIRVTPGITLGGTELRSDGTLRTFTIACGPSIYRGTQFPLEYRGYAVIPEAAGNLVRLDRISGNGADLETRNAFHQTELLASTDERFRPVCSRTGPDGAIYVADLYRGIIEHVIFMMPYLKNQIQSRKLDSPEGLGMGRIYRITYEGNPLTKPPKMTGQKSTELVAHLSHPNGWWRDTAQRLIVEYKATELAPTLRNLATKGENHLARMHALWTLKGLDKLDWKTVSTAIGDQHEMVRSTAIRMSEYFLSSKDEEEILKSLRQTFSDGRPMVNLQLLLTLGNLKGKEAKAELLWNLTDKPGKLFTTAAISGVGERKLEFTSQILADDKWTQRKENDFNLLQMMGTSIMNEGDSKKIARLLEKSNKASATWKTHALIMGALASNRGKGKWPAVIMLEKEPDLLTTLSKSPNKDWRNFSVRLRRILTFPGDKTPHPKRPVPKQLTKTQEKRRIAGEAVYNATCFACHKANGQGLDAQAPPLADSDWVNGPADRLIRIALNGVQGPIKVKGVVWNHTMPGLGSSPILNDERMAALLTYVRRSWGNYGDAVEVEHVAAIRKESTGRTIPWLVEELNDPVARAKSKGSVAPADPLAKYRDALISGDAKRGEEIFHTNLGMRCNACHKIGKSGGGFIGPDLSNIGGRSKDDETYLLESLITPSTKIAEGFQSIIITTRDGKFHSGTLTKEDEKSVVLALMSGGEVIVPVADIKERVSSPISTMPPVGSIFSVQEIADLVAYLKSLQTGK